MDEDDPLNLAACFIFPSLFFFLLPSWRTGSNALSLNFLAAGVFLLIVIVLSFQANIIV